MMTQVGQYVSTAEGIGRVFYLTDYKHVDGKNGIVVPQSVVVIFSDGGATKFSLDAIQPSNELEYNSTIKPQVEPSETETAIT
jgi:hypothetical protein